MGRENGETKENHIDPPQTALDIKNADNNSTGEEEAAAPLNGNHGAESDENSDEGEVGDAAVENQPEDQSSASPNPDPAAGEEEGEEGEETREDALFTNYLILRLLYT